MGQKSLYKAAIIGVGGGRAHGLADAYAHIKGASLAAISTRRPDKLAEFGQKYDVQQRYTDYRDMLQKEKPDLLHVNTPPTVRLEIFEAAEAAGIPAILVEKPLAVQGEDYLAIQAFAQKSKVKIAINHQLHFHPRRAWLQDLVAQGQLGELRFIEASAGMNLAYQGTHSLQAIAAFAPQAQAQNVFAQVSGVQGLEETPRHHYAPDQCLASINYDTGLSAILRCGDNAPRVRQGPNHQHKRIAIYGTQGFIEWTMWSWAYQINGKKAGGSHNYPEEDILGQAAMTEAMLDWLEDDQLSHPLNLIAALNDFNIILGIYTSALNHQVVALPLTPAPDLIQHLRQRLASNEIA